MKPLRIEKFLLVTALLGMFAALDGNAWASTRGCAYSTSGAGMGGTGMPVAGNVISSQGAVKAQSGGRSRNLAAGDAVCVGETIVTAKSASTQIRMADDGMVTVRPETKFKIEKFAYTGSRKDNSLFNLFEGALRVVTGKIGHKHPQNDLIRTPLALIGVRGTDHEVAIIQPGQGGNNPAGVYDKVNTGITFIKTDAGEIDIHANQVGFAAAARELPVLLKETPDFYEAISLHERGAEGGREGHEASGMERSGEHSGRPESGSRGGERPSMDRRF